MYPLSSHCETFSNYSASIMKITTSPDDENGSHHNPFYIAVRSGNVELLDTLINKWSGNTVGVDVGELDETLSQAYEELKLKNILLSEEMEIFVESKLVNLRFFSNASRQDKNVDSLVYNIRARIDLLLQNINILKTDYSNSEKVDEKFLFIAKFITQNIHVLKRLLKSTYDRIPWEEIEFCLVSFVSSFMKHQEINLFYRASLSKSRILNHLNNFAKKLKEVKNILGGANVSKLTDLPQLMREEVIAGIVGNNPQFKELYSDYQKVRDVHSLNRISDYVRLALSADPKERDGQLIIIRVLQVIGEYLKNTLESPKLSSSTSKLLLLSLPRNFRKVLIGLRNSLSHSYALAKRVEIEENSDVKFYIGVQNDTKKIGDVIQRILYNNKIKTVRMLLEKIVKSENIHMAKEVAEIFNDLELSHILFVKNYNVMKRDQLETLMEHNQLEKLVQELGNCISDMTNYEKKLLNQIKNIISSVKTDSDKFRDDYLLSLLSLKSIGSGLNDNKYDHNAFRVMKFHANHILQNFASKVESHNLKEIAQLSKNIFQSASSRTHSCDHNEIIRLVLEIFYIAKFGTDDIRQIEELGGKMNKKGLIIPVRKESKTYITAEKNCKDYLALKLSELKSILTKNELNGKSIDKLSSYKRNEKLQAGVEMLVLDILSIMSRSENHLENNLLFLDDASPLLTGKCLRNHLAHDNALLDVLSSDPSIAVISNAQKFISENAIKSRKKIGKLVRDDPSKLKNRYNQSLTTITNQEKMFAALKEGNLENLTSCLEKGADIHARSIRSLTTLHAAAQGPSLEVVKFLLDQKLDVNVKDVKNRSPLHIAATHGRKNTVEFFIEEAGVSVNDHDSEGRTPLHLAARYGHKNTVDILLKNNADTNTKDFEGYSPLHGAIVRNNIDVAKIMLGKEASVDINETMGGFTCLHIAAEFGYLELVNFLLSNSANVNAKNDKGGIPLHTAALNGHVEVVNALILNGADVNSRIIDGGTSLHYAIENGHEEVANILLKYGANVNAVDKTFNSTPLHLAAKDGHENIVKALLKYKANVRIATVEGMTPLHFAVQSGHFETVSVLLELDININATAINNATPLHFAAESGHKDIAELLIKNGADVRSKDIDRQTPLHVAALKGHKDITELLIRNNARVDTQDITGRTPLHAAAINGSKDVIDLLIESKAEVNARTNDGSTPLHVAALNGQEDAITLLLERKAEVDARNDLNCTPLHAATMAGYTGTVNLLIKNKAKVNADGNTGISPLFLAVKEGHREIVQILVESGADVNVKQNNVSPLLCAIKDNHVEIVKVLLENGASVNEENCEPLSLAVLSGYRDIVEILLINKACVNVKGVGNVTPLHFAAKSGREEIVYALIARGANIDAMATHSLTPLHFAAEVGHEEVAEILIANGADINAVTVDGSAPIHVAAAHGHGNVVEVLLSNGARVNIQDLKNRTPLELAVARGHLQVVKMLLKFKKVDVDAEGNDGFTILHIASQQGNLEMVKCLVDEGCNLNAKNFSGSKPIHIAAREGNIETLKFFLSKGLSINELGIANKTLLHYAASNGHLKVVTYLIAQGADVNAKDDYGDTPMHIATMYGYKDVIEVLLKNSAIYNAPNKLNRRPLHLTDDKNIVSLLASTGRLFESVKRNSSSEVESSIKAGVYINARGADHGTPLHYAAWKGYDEVVKILLQNKANPNLAGSKGWTPLHYAAKFSHLNTVKALLSYGAVYDSVSESGKTPLDFTVDRDIVSLFKLISESFRKVDKGNAQVVNDLKKIKDIDTVKAVMSACNREFKTLVVAAVHCNFSKVEQLKQIFQSDISAQIITTASFLVTQGNYQKALSILKSAFEKRKEILGPNNPGTLDIQVEIAFALYKQGNYQEALSLFEKICQKQEKILGSKNRDTLSTKSKKALVLHRLGKDEEAFNIFQEVCQKQKEMLGPNHPDTLNSQFLMALVLDRQGKYEEALTINRAVFEKRKKMVGIHNPATVSALNNIAMVLNNQGKSEESLKIYEEVFESKKKIYGLNHAETLRTLHSIAAALHGQKKYDRALKAFQEVLSVQKETLLQNHPETLNTQCSIANLLLLQGKHIGAFKAFNEILDLSKAVFGPSHPMVLDILEKLKLINSVFKYQSLDGSEVLQHLQKDINIAASNGDRQTVQRLLNSGADANDKDIDGRTPLHYAVGNGHLDIVNILLKNGAVVTQATNKGNTPLHTASSKGYQDIVEILLQHISHDASNDFLNAKTTSNGTSALHVAAKGGFLEIVKSLLKHGAIFEIENKEGKIPIDLTKDPKVTSLLKLIKDLFQDVKNGNNEAIIKLEAVKTDEFLAVTKARNKQRNTLLQVAIANKHKITVGKLLQLLKRPDQIL